MVPRTLTHTVTPVTHNKTTHSKNIKVVQRVKLIRFKKKKKKGKTNSPRV